MSQSARYFDSNNFKLSIYTNLTQSVILYSMNCIQKASLLLLCIIFTCISFIIFHHLLQLFKRFKCPKLYEFIWNSICSLMYTNYTFNIFVSFEISSVLLFIVGYFYDLITFQMQLKEFCLLSEHCEKLRLLY